jgi:hypothetical protein
MWFTAHFDGGRTLLLQTQFARMDLEKFTACPNCSIINIQLNNYFVSHHIFILFTIPHKILTVYITCLTPHTKLQNIDFAFTLHSKFFMYTQKDAGIPTESAFLKNTLFELPITSSISDVHNCAHHITPTASPIRARLPV